MPLPARLARINKRVTNRISGPFAGRLPPFAFVRHVGRKSGKPYTTPVMVFRRDSDFIIVLTYGLETEWCKNVLAAGGATLIYRSRSHSVVEPEIVPLTTVEGALPGIVKLVLNRAHVKHALVLRERETLTQRAPNP